jgi:putative transposase
MRLRRVKLDGAASYHVMSRVIERRFIFGDVEKSYLHNLMRRLEDFTGCEVRTYAFMDNHFHLLLHVPQRRDVSDAEVRCRVRALYGKKRYAVMEQEWALWIDKGMDFKVRAQFEAFRNRMYDLSEFMKCFKQRFSVYYNAGHNRRGVGPLWSERFKSVLVEESESAQLTVAAYIDLNPVRAGIVEDPKDYRWSGYAEALGRGGRAQEGISGLFSDRKSSVGKHLTEYRRTLYCEGVRRVDDQIGTVVKLGFTRAVTDRVLDDGGKLPLTQLLRCRVRYLSEGVIVGGREFVDKMIGEQGQFSNLRRRRGAKEVMCGARGVLCVARELRSTVISISRSDC